MPAPHGRPGQVHRPRRFDLVGYTGGKMSVPGYPRPIVVDLSTLYTAQTIPILYDHVPDVEYVVGKTDSVRVDGSRLLASGLMLGLSAVARKVVDMAVRGYTRQASVGCEPGRVVRVEPGDTATVSGRTLAGPFLIAEDAELHEISFVTLGADGRPWWCGRPSSRSINCSMNWRRCRPRRPRWRRPSGK